MSLRIRADGTIHCAAIHHDVQPGDRYVDDSDHYTISVIFGLLVTEPLQTAGFYSREGMPVEYGRGGHAKHGEWWWRSAVPADVYDTIDWWPRIQPLSLLADDE